MPKKEEPQRQCIVTRESGGKAGLLRFVLSPAGELVADIDGKLPGRGMWVTAERPVLEEALAKKLFSRAAKQQVAIPQGLADRVEGQLRQRVIDSLSLCRKAGMVVTGFEKVKAALASGEAAALLHADDAGEDGINKLRGASRDILVYKGLQREEMAPILDRENPVHVIVLASPVAEKFLGNLRRFAGFRGEHLL